MTEVLNIKHLRGTVGVEWLSVVAGLLILSVSSFHDLASSLRQTDEATHPPIILALVIWLICDKRQIVLVAPTSTGPVLASRCG